MGSKKKYLRIGINFGKQGELSREIVEEFIRQKGKMHLSDWIRQLVCVSVKPPVEIKVPMLHAQFEENRQKLYPLIKEKERILRELAKLGIECEKLV